MPVLRYDLLPFVCGITIERTSDTDIFILQTHLQGRETATDPLQNKERVS